MSHEGTMMGAFRLLLLLPLMLVAADGDVHPEAGNKWRVCHDATAAGDCALFNVTKLARWFSGGIGAMTVAVDDADGCTYSITVYGRQTQTGDRQNEGTLSSAADSSMEIRHPFDWLDIDIDSMSACNADASGLTVVVKGYGT